MLNGEETQTLSCCVQHGHILRIRMVVQNDLLSLYIPFEILVHELTRLYTGFVVAITFPGHATSTTKHLYKINTTQYSMLTYT